MKSDERENNSNEADTDENATERRWYRINVGSKGRGLFATQAIPPRTLLHIAHCIRLSKEDYEKHMKFTVLEHYLFNDRATGDKLMALGDGSLFNHSKRPNVDYRIAVKSYGPEDHPEIQYMTGHSVVQPDEELCISYGSNLWFDDADGDEGITQSTEEDNENSCDDITKFLAKMQL